MKWIGISSSVVDRRLRAGRKTTRGFTLTEFAIVLGVGGLILGGIWAAMSGSKENVRQETLKNNLLVIVKNVRSFYAGQSSTGAVANLTPQLTGLTPPAIPGDILRANGTEGCAQPFCADHPWATTAAAAAKGSMAFCGWIPGAGGTVNCTGGATNSQFFAVELLGVPLESCIKAVINNSGADAPPGLIDIEINSTSMLALGNFPVKATDTRKNCTANSTIDFVYRLSTPQS